MAILSPTQIIQHATTTLGRAIVELVYATEIMQKEVAARNKAEEDVATYKGRVNELKDKTQKLDWLENELVLQQGATVKAEATAAKAAEDLAREKALWAEKMIALEERRDAELVESERRRGEEVAKLERKPKADLAHLAELYAVEIAELAKKHEEQIAELADYGNRMSHQVCLLKEAAKQIDGEPIVLPPPLTLSEIQVYYFEEMKQSMDVSAALNLYWLFQRLYAGVLSLKDFRAILYEKAGRHRLDFEG